LPASLHANLAESIASLEEATRWLVETYPQDARAASGVAVPYLKLFGTVAGGWMMARAALAAQAKLKDPAADRDFLEAKVATACFYAEHELPRALPLAREVTRGAASVLALDPGKF
jgi:hypothetical protein